MIYRLLNLTKQLQKRLIKEVVQVRLHRARKALKEILDRDCKFDHDERNVFVCTPIETEF